MYKFGVGVILVAAAVSAQTIKRTNVERTSAASGEEMYISYCASCHGKDGKGNGPAASAMKKMPTDLTALSKSSGGKFPSLRLRSAIEGDPRLVVHGSPEMPVWGMVFRNMGDDAEVSLRMSNLVGYIEKLQK